MKWLGIHTATNELSIAIMEDERVMASYTNAMAVNHSVRAMPAISRLLEEVQMKPSELDAIAVTEGPGSYTGVRIGVTIAKTLGWSLKIPVVGVSTLAVLAAAVSSPSVLICPLIDARREHVYSGVYTWQDGELISIVPDGYYSLEELLIQIEEKYTQTIYFVGVDSEKWYPRLAKIKGAHFLNMYQTVPSALSLISLAKNKEKEQMSSSIHHFTPTYHRISEAEANWLKTQKDKEQ